MLRSLLHYWRINLAVALGAAVATAVLTGALLMGDSVRGSLRQLTLERLGQTELALTAPRFFRQDVATELQTALAAGGEETATPVVAPLVSLRGAATHGETRARASRVAIHGLDDAGRGVLQAGDFDFSRREGQIYVSVLLNQALARELGAAVGDAVVLSFQRASDVPRDSLLGERDPTLMIDRVRASVAQIVPDRGPGRFGLEPRQGTPLNAFMALSDLQRALDRRQEINGLLVTGSRGPSPDRSAGAGDGVERARRALDEVLTLEDLDLLVSASGGIVQIESRAFVLDAVILEAVENVARETAAPVQTAHTYLANEIRLGDRAVPYSTVAAVTGIGAPFLDLKLVSGEPSPLLSGNGVLLNEWAAARLQASAGDQVEMTYFAYGPREELITRKASFHVEGVVAMQGLGADETLTPDYPGIQDAQNIADWNPPFPVDLDAIQPADEAYWDDWKGTPKAFISMEKSRELWATRHGDTTLLRVAVPEAGGPAAFSDALRRRIDAGAAGFQLRPVRAEGLQSSAGATEFSGLFLAFSFFLILSSALLVGLLFGLGVEARASQIGLLLSLGFRQRRVRGHFMSEGLVVAACGAVLGAAVGVGYAALLILGLTTLWLPAVGSSHLELHVLPGTLATGVLISMVVILMAIWFSVRRIAKVPTPALLAGSTRIPERPGRTRLWSRTVSIAGFATALVLLAVAVGTGRFSSPGLSFGIGASLLAAGLGLFTLWCRTARHGGLPGGGAALPAMAMRNSAWNPGRSILSVALVGFASFVIFTVASNRGGHQVNAAAPESGAGAYDLVAESSLPLLHDLNRADARGELGLPEDELQGATFFSLRFLPGEDASCLNLYKPERPRVVGVPPEMIARGGFTFQAVAEEVDNPWTLLQRELEPGVIPALADAHSAQWILKLGIGEDIVMEDELGNEVRLRLMGLLQKSIFQSELLVSERDFLRHFPGRSGYGYFLVDTPDGRRDQMAETLEAGLSRFGFDSTPTSRRLADFQAVENTYLSTFQTLGAFGLLLGTVGLGIVLLRNVLERRRELATLRAFGFRSRRITTLILAENAYLLVAGLCIGSGAALVAVLPRLFGGGLQLPWASLIGTELLVLAVGMISSVAAVLGALRAPLIPSLKDDR